MRYTGTYSNRQQAQQQRNASRAEMLRDIISVRAMCHDDLEELEDMTNLIVYVATRKARRAQRARKFAQSS